MSAPDRLTVYAEVAAALRATGEHGSEHAALLVEQLADGLGDDSVAAELAALPPDLRAVAERVRDLDEIEPAPGWEERAIERARRPIS